MEEKKKIAIGCDDFNNLKGDKEVYYIDKSLFIRDVIDNKSSVALITRPRRFGKTLNMSMLDSYFNIDRDSKELFKDLKIMKEGSKYTDYLNNVPVIFFSYKGVRARNYDEMVEKLKESFAKTYRKYRYLLDSDRLASDEKHFINDVLNRESYDLTSVFSNLSEFLYKHYGKKALILIDEYDIPIQEAYHQGFYDDAVTIMKATFEETFKGNENMLKAIITGVSRITKEGIFTGANNFKVYTVLKSKEFSDDFGFTEEEVNDALTYYELTNEKAKVKEMYDGYKIGEISNIYNPWSILNYLSDKDLCPYWVNTSSNNVINKVIEKNTYIDIKEDLDRLLNNETIKVKIDDEVSIKNIDESIDNIWSLFLGSGYLRVVDTIDANSKIYTVKIPNKEIMLLFQDIVNSWFQTKLRGKDLQEMLQSLIKLDTEDFEYHFKEVVITMFSYFDVPNNKRKTTESFYHAFVLGLTTYLRDEYYIHSNRESGHGRYDICLEAINHELPSFIFEFKLQKNQSINKLIIEATNQVNNNVYITTLQERGITNIHKFIFIFKGKDVTIKEIN